MHFTATGNFKNLHASLQGVQRQVGQSMAGMGGAVQNVAPQIDAMNRSLQTQGKLSTQMAVAHAKSAGAIIRQSKAMQAAQTQVMMDSTGRAKVFLDVQRSLGEATVKLSDRFRFMNTILHATGRNMIAVGKNMQWAGRQVTVGLTVPLMLLAGVAGRAAEEYNRQFTRILKVNNEASAAALHSAEMFELVTESIRRQSDALVEYGAARGFMAADTSAMVAELSQMGFYGQTLDRISESSMRLSRISGTELKTSLELSRLAVQAFKVPLDELDESFARLNMVENNTALSLDELAQAMPVIAGVVATMGVSIEETSGLLAMMKENGIGANEGATALRTGLLRIVQDATDPAIEAFAKINLDLEAMQERMAAGTDDLEAGSIFIFFDELSEKLQSLEGNQAQLNEFAAAISKLVGVRSSARFLSFLTEIGDRFDENTTAGRAWIGVMSDAEEAMRVYELEERLIQESAAGTADRLRAELNYELVKLGENFLGVANKAREFARDLLAAFNNMNPKARNFVMILGLIIAALGPVTMLAGIMTNAFGQILTIITKLLPKFNLVTAATRAQEAAYDQLARSTITASVAQDKLAASLDRVAVKQGIVASGAGRTSGALAATNAAAAASAAGVPRALTSTQGGASNAAVRNATAQNIVRHGGTSGGLKDSALAGAVFMERFRKAVLSFPKFVGGKMLGLAGIFAGVLAKAISPIGRLLSKVINANWVTQAVGMAGKGAAAGAGKGVMAGIGAAGAAPLAVKAAIVGIVAAIAAVPILADPAAFMEKFRAAIEGPMERIRAIWSSIQDQVSRIVGLFRSSTSDGGGLSTMAEIIGTIAGYISKGLLIGFELVMRAIETIAHWSESIVHIWNALGKFLSGDFAGAWEAVKEAGRAAMRGILSFWGDALAWIFDRMADIAEMMPDWVPGMERIETVSREIASNLRSGAYFQSNTTDAVLETEARYREVLELIEEAGSAIQDAEQFVDRLAEAGVDITNMTEQEIIDRQTITQEMKIQAIASKRILDSEAKLLELTALRADLEKRLVNLRLAGESASVESLRWTARGVAAIDTQISEVTSSILNAFDNVSEEFDLAAELAAWQDEADGFNDELGVSEERIEDLEKQAEGLRDRIRESEEAAKAFASALKSGMGEIMSDIESAVMLALEMQREQMEAQFDARIEAIENAAQAELDRIDAIEAREERLERERKRWFEQQRARIEYLKRTEQENVSMNEALARGDIAQASIIRIGLQRDAELYMLDSYEREYEAYKEARQSELVDKRDAVEQTKQLALEQLQLEIDVANAAYEARKRSIELYLRDWKRITPATEAEFNQHLGALTSAMDGFGINMTELSAAYTELSGRTIIDGFTHAINLARDTISEDDKWKNAGEASGAAFRAGLAAELAKIEKDLDDLRNGIDPDIGGAGSTSSSPPSYTMGGVTYSVGSGSTSGSYTGPTRTPSRSSGEPPNRTYTANTRSGGAIGTVLQRFHSGGGIDGMPNMPGLKRDESAYVLQHGEFVVQRDAVKALGLDYMRQINQAKRHSGGLIDFSGASIKEANITKAMAGYAGGAMGTSFAAEMVGLGGGKAKMTSKDRSTKGGRALGTAVGKQIGEAVKAFAPMGQALGSMADWAASGKWPPRKWAQISPNTKAAQAYFQAQGGFPGGIGSGVHRGVQASDHSWGKALDFMVAPLGRYAKGDQYKRGWQVANWHLENPNAFGTKYVIWDKLINTGDARGWRPYTRYGDNPGATLGHYDHVHVSYLHDGGLAGLRKGGKIRFDDTVARLHKGETVIDAPGTRAMENAVKMLTNSAGGGNTYELNIRVDGGNIDERRLAKFVMSEIEQQELRAGRKRVVRG